MLERSRVGPGEPLSNAMAGRPQGGAAGRVFLLIQSAVGLEVDAGTHRATSSGAVVPQWLDDIDIRGMQIDGERIDVRIRRGGRGSAIEVLGRSGDVEILVGK